MIKQIIAGLISPVTSIIKKVQEGKQAKESAQAKIKQARVNNEYNLELSDKEWEALGKASEDGTFKDDATTYTFLGILILIFLAALLSAFTGNSAYIDSVKEAVEQVNILLEADTAFSDLMFIVVCAAVGVKAGKRIIR